MGTEFLHIKRWSLVNRIQFQEAVTGDSEFNGQAERINKEITIIYGLLTSRFKPEKKKKKNQD